MDASDVLLICASNYASTSLTSMEPAKRYSINFRVQMNKVKNVQKFVYEELIDLLVNLQRRNLC